MSDGVWSVAGGDGYGRPDALDAASDSHSGGDEHGDDATATQAGQKQAQPKRRKQMTTSGDDAADADPSSVDERRKRRRAQNAEAQRRYRSRVQERNRQLAAEAESLRQRAQQLQGSLPPALLSGLQGMQQAEHGQPGPQPPSQEPPPAHSQGQQGQGLAQQAALQQQQQEQKLQLLQQQQQWHRQQVQQQQAQHQHQQHAQHAAAAAAAAAAAGFPQQGNQSASPSPSSSSPQPPRAVALQAELVAKRKELVDLQAELRVQISKKEARDQRAEQQTIAAIEQTQLAHAATITELRNLVVGLESGTAATEAQEEAIRPHLEQVLRHIADLEQAVLAIFRRYSRGYCGKDGVVSACSVKTPERKLMRLLDGPLGAAVKELSKYDRAAQQTAGAWGALEQLHALRKEQGVMLDSIRVNLEQSSNAHDLLSLASALPSWTTSALLIAPDHFTPH